MSSSSSAYDLWSDEEENDLIGEIVNNKYVLLYELGRGAFATVYLALHINSKQYFAIKMQDEEELESAMEEVDLLKKFGSDKNCKYLNSLVEHFTCDLYNTRYTAMVMTLMAGSTYDIIRTGAYSKGLPLGVVKSIMKQLLTAMVAIQGKPYGILHSDIKPENILVGGVNNKVKELIDLYNDKKFMSNFNTGLDKKLKKKLDKGKIKKAVGAINVSDIEKKYSKDRANTVQFIDDKYIKNIEVKLSDFGNCKELNYRHHDIQTRYYRAPEIILGYPYDERCDMWSVGCMLFELLTGRILFDPQKHDRFSTDRTHIYNMICVLGNIPKELIDKSKYGVNFFKVNGQLKGDAPDIKYLPLYQILRETLKDREDYNEENLFALTDLIYKLLNYFPEKRPHAREALTHKFFM